MGKKAKERKRTQQLREREHAAAVVAKADVGAVDDVDEAAASDDDDDGSSSISSAAATNGVKGGGGGGGAAVQRTVFDDIDVTPDELVSGTHNNRASTDETSHTRELLCTLFTLSVVPRVCCACSSSHPDLLACCMMMTMIQPLTPTDHTHLNTTPTH
jgi:hypothetical protein